MKLAAIGLDLGSTAAKAVAVDADGILRWSAVEPADPRMGQQGARLRDLALEAAGGRVPVVATGYGRELVEADRRITEISCHARGASDLLRGAGTLIDVGGQDTKVIRLDLRGRVGSFAMNDRCAAGSGRFLENTASRLRLDLDQLDALAVGANSEQMVSSTCVVFAETEIVSLLAGGASLDALARGLFRSLARRVGSLAGGISAKPPFAMSGGVARLRAMRELLGEVLGSPVICAERPELCGALGAARLGLEP